MLVFTLLVLASSGAAEAAGAATWQDYLKRNSLTCVGPFESTLEPTELTLADKKYRLSGSRLSALETDADDEVRLGVLSSIKDLTDETRRNLDTFMAWFKTEKVEWLVLNGDLAGDEEELEELFGYFGERALPTLTMIGNYESRGSYFRAVAEAAKKYPNIIDQNLIRIVEADDVNILSMPGYYDRKFIHTGSGCQYRREDVEALLDQAEKVAAPKLLISHGPPKGVGPKSIDVVADGQLNVGDPALTSLIRAGNVAFGIFGHILESGGRAVAGDLKTPVGADTFSSKLFINAGTANSLPWGLLDGSTASGMAAVVSIKGQKAKVKFRTANASRATPLAAGGE